MDQLFRRALEARGEAYTPYSGFKVGAALLTTGGEVFTGCNIENASFGLTICAERVAIYKAIAQGNRSFKAILNVTNTKEPTPPCGACRQVMAEFSPDLLVIMMTTEGRKKEISLQELFPDAFTQSSMGEGKA